jgi:hypothetical protein
MKLFFLLPILFCGIASALLGEPITIDAGGSPDGRFYLTVEPGPEGEGVAEGTIQIRSSGSNKIVGTFPFEGFGESPGEECLYDIHWNQDDTALAYCWEITRGYGECAVYALRKGQWSQIKLPDFVQAMLERQGLKGGDGKGYEKPIRRDSKGVLKVQIYERAAPREYNAYLKLKPSGDTMRIIRLVRRAEDQ